MAEPLGIVGVIGVAVQLIQTCTKLHSDWKNAPADAKNFILELQNLKTILSEMNRNVIENPKFAKAFYGEHSSLLAEFDPHRKTETKAMLSVCKDELDGLLQRLEKRRDGPRLGWERLKAAFDGPGARQAVTNLQRRCLSLSLLLQPDMALLAADTRQEVKEGREEQKQHHQTQMGALDHICDRVDEQGTRFMQARIGEEQEAALKWLTPIDYAAQHSDFLKRRQLGTGQWLLDSAEFKTWVGTPKQVLFCPGIPGAGKTILTSIVIDHLRSHFNGNPKVGVAYLYCNFRRKDTQKVEDLLSSLLTQLTRGLPCFPAAVECLYAGHKADQTRPSLDELAKTLCSVAELYEERVFIVVDALDECQESAGSRFLAELEKLQSSSRPKVNIFATSRPNIPDIMENFKGHPWLEILASREDIQQYLEGHMDELGPVVNQSQDIQQEIIDGILDAADGMFLLAERFFQALADTITITEMRKVLAQFQKESDVSNKDHKLRVLRLAYDQAMQRINDQRLGHQRLAKHVLSWITHSERPLTPLELRHAWAVKDSEDELDEGSLPATDDLVAVCAGLVTIDDLSGIIRLVHYTTQEYFEQTRARWFPDAEYEMAMICAKYLMFRTFNGGICQTRKEYEELLASNPLFEYAATNCFRHAEKDSSGHGCDEVANLLRSRANYKAADQVSDVTMYQAMTGYEYDWFESPWQQGYTPEGLHLAANLGLKHVVQHFIRTDHPDTRDRWGLTPLCYAAESGHEDVVQVLLATRRVDVNANREGHGTPLILAISEGNEGVVNLLLATEYMEIDVNTEDELGDLPISAAARCPTKAIADALLATNRVDFTLRNRRGETALHLLAHAPDDIVVEIIQSPEIRSQVVEVVNWKDSLGCTALSIAVQKHRDRMVKALLAWGEVDVNARDKEGWTTLRHAYDGEYGPAGSSTVQLLIAHGAHE